jgi:hypothetical protein
MHRLMAAAVDLEGVSPRVLAISHGEPGLRLVDPCASAAAAERDAFGQAGHVGAGHSNVEEAGTPVLELRSGVPSGGFTN